MAKVRANKSKEPSRKMRPALTPEADENQMISLAMDLVRQRLIDGTASSQETTHFLKLAGRKARLENEILEVQKELIVAKKENLQAQKRSDEMFEKAMQAFRGYIGQGTEEPEDDDEY